MFKIGETCLYSVWILIGLPKMILGTHHKEKISHKCEFFYDSLNGCQEKITSGTGYKQCTTGTFIEFQVINLPEYESKPGFIPGNGCLKNGIKLTF